MEPGIKKLKCSSYVKFPSGKLYAVPRSAAKLFTGRKTSLSRTECSRLLKGRRISFW